MPCPVILGHLQGWGLQASLGSLFQCLKLLAMKKFLLISNLNRLWHSLMLYPPNQPPSPTYTDRAEG